MNLPTPTPRRLDDIAALDQLTLRLDAIFGDLISDVKFAELIDNFKQGLDEYADGVE